MKKVLVTGISGFVGQHCAAELLENGYAVRGSLRSLSRQEEVIQGIKKVIDPQQNLEFCELNLSSDDGWAEAMQGCEFVLHVASPYINKEPKDENDYIKPALDGTLRALRFAKKAGIKRVVLTSSLVAMQGDNVGIAKLNQDSWSDENSKNINAYMKSKTIAEKAAWEFINSQGDDSYKLELTVVNPGPIYGPTLTNNLSGESMKMFAQLLQGKMPMLPNISIPMSDVRDIAKIHVAAMENPKASGKRFIVTTKESYTFKNLAQKLKQNGYDKVSTKVAPNTLLKFVALFSRDVRAMLPFIGNRIFADISQTQEVFGWRPIAIEKTVLDTAKSVMAALKK